MVIEGTEPCHQSRTRRLGRQSEVLQLGLERLSLELLLGFRD